MSKISEFPGPSKFDPDDVMGEEERGSSAFNPRSGNDNGSTGNDSSVERAKASFPLGRVLIIGAVLIVVGGTIFMTLKPLLFPKQVSNSIPTMPFTQASREAPTQASAPSSQQQFSAPPQGQANTAGGTGSSPMASEVTAVAPTNQSAPALSAAVAASPLEGLAKSQAPLLTTDPATTSPSTDVRLTAVELRAAHLEVQLAAVNEALEALKKPQAQHGPAKAVRRAPATLVSKAASASTSQKAVSLPAGNGSHGTSGPGPTLKAVLTDRAWFQTASGSTITVSTGDSVPGYGQVQSINADAGEVHFSNGTVVR